MPELSPIDLFSNKFDAHPEWLITAPGRINLIGEHIDYLEGFVMPAAIDRSLRLAIRATDQPLIRLRTNMLGSDKGAELSFEQLVPLEGDDYWLNYVAGPIEMLRRVGIEPRGFDAAITSSLPTGAGLSSSAALETAIALAMEAVTGVSLDPTHRARLCQQAEHEFAGVPCGIMDQLAVGLGQENHALMIDCRDQSVVPVSIPDGVAILVADTGVNHALGDGEYRKRRESCEAALTEIGKSSWREVTRADLSSLDGELFHRARHAVTEMERVPQMRTALEAGDFSRVGELMRAGHDSLRLDFEVSCPELDYLVDVAYDFGVIGSRMTGGGFGGSTVTLVREEVVDSLKHHLEDAYRRKFDRDLNAFITRASNGATTRKL